MYSEAGLEWNRFIEEVQNTRIDLKCSSSNAWFRGHSNHNWALQPTLIREHIIGTANAGGDLSPHITDEDFQRIANILKSTPYRLRFSADQAKKVNYLLKSIVDGQSKLSFIAKQGKELQDLSNDILHLQGNNRQTLRLDFSKITDICRKHKIPMLISQGENERIAAIRNIDLNLVRTSHEKNKLLQKNIGFQLEKDKTDLRSTIAVAYGERDAFTEFQFRWRESLGSGWSILARMQHYGVPTRLLDWSESLFVGLWFALEPYLDEVARAFRKTPDIRPGDLVQSIFLAMSERPEPSIWIMNPYYLAQASIGENRISDLTLEDKIDYYASFFESGWPYKYPLPIYSPWRDERLGSQHAMFTVHGTDLRPLEQQVEKRVLQELKIGRKAAAFGAYQLSTINAVDRFSLFRDMDSFGKMIKDRYISRR